MALTEHRTPTPTRQATPSRLRMTITFPRANRTPGAFIIMGRFSLLCYGEIIVILYTLYTPLVFPRFRFDRRMFCVTVPFLRFDSRTASADADADAAVTVADVSAAAVAVADVSAAAVAVAAVSAAAAAATADADADAVSAVAAASEFAPVFAPVPAATVTYFNTCKRQFTLLNEQIYRKINVSSLFLKASFGSRLFLMVGFGIPRRTIHLLIIFY